MGRLIAFLGVGIVVGLLATVFQIPNMMTIMLVILWVGMGCGLNIVLALIGSVILPLAMAIPMWLLPGPNNYHRLYPPDDSLLVEFYTVDGAHQLYSTDVADYQKEKAANPTDNSLQVPTMHEANMQALDAAAQKPNESKHFAVWPTTTTYIVGLVLTLLVSVFNTVTTKPFRPAGALGQP